MEIEAPNSSEVVVSQAEYEIRGRTSLDATVSVNDTVVDVDGDGRFSQKLTLDPGPNLVEVVASSANGDETSAVLTIIYESK